MSYYSYPTKKKAAPRKEWDDFLLYVRKQLGCDSKTIPSIYRVERRYLAHSMKMVIHCDWEPPRVGEFDLGYLEIHEEGLVSYEYHSEDKIGSRPTKEVFVALTDPEYLARVDAFLDDAKQIAGMNLHSVRERERVKKEQERAKKEAEEQKKIEEAKEKAHRAALRAVEAEKDRERRRVRDAERRQKEKAARMLREQEEAEQRAAREAVEYALSQERIAKEAVESAARETIRLAELARREKLALLKAVRRDQDDKEAARRREEWLEVGVTIPENLDGMASTSTGTGTEAWHPHILDVTLAGYGLGWLLYWLLA